MLAEFPDDYPRYRQRVPQLVPGLRMGRVRRSLPKLFLNGINDILVRPGRAGNFPAAFYLCRLLSDKMIIAVSSSRAAGLGQINADAR